MLLEKIIIEGIMPERALSKLQREGICVYHAKKLKKNQILLSVKKKDTEKVFAICPNVCYNMSEEDVSAAQSGPAAEIPKEHSNASKKREPISAYTPYTSKKAGAEGLLAVLDWCKRRIGVFLGGALFVAATLAANNFVFKIEVTGAETYRREVLVALEENGIRTFSLYPKDREEEVAAKILSLKDVSYCSVEKSGMTVKVDVRLSAFSEPSPEEGDMLAKHSGTIVQSAVLRGTPLKNAGDEVEAGETLVGAYLLSESGERPPVTAIARVTLSCVYDEIVAADSEERALAEGYLAIDGEIAEKTCEQTDGGFRVRIVYTVTETINF